MLKSSFNTFIISTLTKQKLYEKNIIANYITNKYKELNTTKKYV